MSTIQDGYGDAVDLENYLRDRDRLLHWKAAGDEEAVQEARIKVWQTLAAHPEATRSYLDRAATWRIQSVLRGESLTGEARPHGGKDTQPDPLRAPHAGSDGVTALRDEVEDLDSAHAAQQVLDAYHHGEIMQALATLPEAHRAYVVLRFWAGLDRNEIGHELHRNPGNLATTWRTQIAPRLRESLAHLVAV